jgi:hypothetical protein
MIQRMIFTGSKEQTQTLKEDMFFLLKIDKYKKKV